MEIKKQSIERATETIKGHNVTFTTEYLEGKKPAQIEVKALTTREGKVPSQIIGTYLLENETFEKLQFFNIAVADIAELSQGIAESVNTIVATFNTAE